MHISHLTRFAVNLSLIVSLAFQPVAACLASVDCASDCTRSRSHPSHACGCCQADRADSSCCCGVERSQSKAIAQRGSTCCGKADDSSTPTGMLTADASSRLNAVFAREQASALRTVCLCEQDASPFGDSSPRRNTVENRESVLLAWINFDERARGQRVPASQFGPRLPVSSHHSQLMLCIWRL